MADEFQFDYEAEIERLKAENARLEQENRRIKETLAQVSRDTEKVNKECWSAVLAIGKEGAGEYAKLQARIEALEECAREALPFVVGAIRRMERGGRKHETEGSSCGFIGRYVRCWRRSSRHDCREMKRQTENWMP